MNITTNLIKLSSHKSDFIARTVYVSRYQRGPEATAEKFGQNLPMIPQHNLFNPATDRRHYTMAELLQLDAYPSGIFYSQNYLIGQADDITDVYFILGDSAKKSN